MTEPVSTIVDLLDGEPLRDAQAVAELLAGVDRLGVAYSGGVDSAVLVALAVRALGPNRVVPLLAVSESLAGHERQIAHQVAAEIGVEVVELVTHETANPAYQANNVARCFHCKDELFTQIDEVAVAAHGLDAVAYGENADDALRPDRPGSAAATQHRVLRPLADAGVSKARVRAIARALGLSVADKPAAPCLASRIPHGDPVTPEKLRQVETGEAVLRAAGFTDSRLRHHGTIARIEVPSHEIARFAEEEVRSAVLTGIREAGFANVTVDLAGLQSGAFTLQILGRRS